MRLLARRLILLTLSILAVMTLIAPASAHANHRLHGRRFSCGPFVPAFVIPVRTGNIVVFQDRCGREFERFQPHRRHRFFDDFDDFDRGGPNYTVVFNNVVF